MAEQTFSLEFKGYWRDVNKSGLPQVSGVYCVYECTFDIHTSKVALNKLIYIGESEDVNSRMEKHEKYEDWKKHVSSGNELCFTCAGVNGGDRERCEAAMIFKHKPPVNDEYRNSFPFDRTTMSLTGCTALLTANFTVNRT